ncbi:MAG: ankyrin repeat domain-containing protein [archaeon]|nr:ankyrin repeat domain-containing protein [archaeon]
MDLATSSGEPAAPDAPGSWAQVWEGESPWPPLLWAAHECGKTRVDNDSRTLLHWACVKGDGEVLRTLLRDGGCREAVLRADKQKWTPLLSAASAGHSGVVRELLQALEGPEKASALGHTNHMGCGPLHYAASKGHAEILALLISSLPDPAASALDAANSVGETPLLRAVASRRFSAASVLIQAGASAHTRNGSGENVLHLLASEPQLAEDAEGWALASSLLSLRCRPEDLRCRSLDGHSPLDIALRSANMPFARLIKQHLADPVAAAASSPSAFVIPQPSSTDSMYL